MIDNYALISTICAALVLAFLFGALARRLGLSPLVGYLLAGVAVGPFTPGFVGDAGLAMQLAEIGVILLMFGVGLKFSIADLWSVRRIAIPGALVQMAAATALGYGVGRLMGLADAESLMLGASLSVASTVVLLRELEDRRLLKQENGRITVGWLVVEDIAIVLAIVLLPMLARMASGEIGDAGAALAAFGLTALKIASFIALMLIVGARIFPWLIVQVAHLKSRELLSLGTIALALGVAFAAYFLFEASFALGAFLAGVVLNGTKFTHKIAEDSQPLRDTFAVLFFVSVGMLFDPATLWTAPLGVTAVVSIIVLGKGLAALAITALFRIPFRTGLLIAVALAQIGEFSFVLAALGAALGLVGAMTYNLILAGALVSIALNPLLFRLADPPGPRPGAAP
ncbi:MAG: cation:proton antiporter [Hydrogenophilaceae bacterium]|jgi:CPA2 family monovalent cation:H+ antiporter-2|nr:cation:proton antiporter [Hydrogenophilaceae bacterium]